VSHHKCVFPNNLPITFTGGDCVSLLCVLSMGFIGLHAHHHIYIYIYMCVYVCMYFLISFKHALLHCLILHAVLA